MGAASRALGALALATAVLLPAASAVALPGEDPAAPPGSAPSAASGTASGTNGMDPTSGLTAKTPSGTTAQILVSPRSGSVPAPGIAADSWMVVDLDSGAVLASQNADLPVRPASTQKLLTALTVSQRLSPDQPYRAVKADEEAEGNRVVLYAGLKYLVSDLMHAALLPSANDAAAALARANGGVDVTVEQMNAEAARLGARSTTVKNPSGLDEDGQETTAHDMALIGRAAFANPEIAAYLRLRVVDFPGKVENGKRVVYPIYNHNRMLAHANFAGALGGKSGFTSKAGNTLVAAAERDGRRYLVTLFRIGGNTYRTGEALLNWAFAQSANLQPIGQLEEPSAPAPEVDRSVQPLPEVGKLPEPRTEGSAAAADAPTAPASGSGWTVPSLPSLPGLPSPLTLLTLLMAVVVVLRARVYWIAHRSRTAWIDLDAWARTQARSARRPGPQDRRVRPAASGRRSGSSTDEALVSSRR
jgi:D-alanyl-D-alanine carboxypeptidase (penicillin-binding protein 5/6)